MKIRYLKDGVKDISDDTDVVAEGLTGYYVASDKCALTGVHPERHILRYVPREFVVLRYYSNSHDDPPNIFEIAPQISEDFEDVDFSLSDLFSTLH